jgi:phosphoethanolamine N-methyltransferase
MPDKLPAIIAMRYSRDVALRHEALYGRGYQGPAERDVFDALVARVAPRPGERFLDVGSGLGGDAVRLATSHGVRVVGLDASADMTALARERVAVDAPDAGVELVTGDVLSADLDALGPFDVVWTRDAGAFVPYADKASAWRRLHGALRPGGRVLVTDYCLGGAGQTSDFARRMVTWGQFMVTFDEYAELLRGQGFVDVATEDRTADLIASQEHGLRVLGDPAAWGPHMSRTEAADLEGRWRTKLEHSTSGDLRWLVLTARRADPARFAQS